LFDGVNEYLASRGLKVAGGTIVDAAIIAAPSSTKNKTKARDPEMGELWSRQSVHCPPSAVARLTGVVRPACFSRASNGVNSAAALPAHATNLG
jgi:hypothetical protein